MREEKNSRKGDGREVGRKARALLLRACKFGSTSFQPAVYWCHVATGESRQGGVTTRALGWKTGARSSHLSPAAQ